MSPKPKKGNPFVQVRLDPDIIQAIKAQVEEEKADLQERGIPLTGPGQSSGVSHWIRKLIYRELGKGDPPEHTSGSTPYRRPKKTSR